MPIDLTPITLASSVKSSEVRQESEAVQHYLWAIGVQLDVREFDDWPAFRKALQHGELQMFRYAWYADYPDPDNFLYPLFHSQSQTNYFRYSNPVVDELLNNARRETDDRSVLNHAPPKSGREPVAAGRRGLGSRQCQAVACRGAP